MAKIPAAVSKRLTATVPKFSKILAKAKERDINESDTVTIVTDMLEEIFGFDKYSEITREYAIRGDYCDLAIKSGKRVEYLIEVKAIGIDLRDNHLKQAINYAANEGIKWVVLTNGTEWHVHRVRVEGKIQNELLFKLDFSYINARKADCQEILFMLCKRGVEKDLIDDFYEYRQSVNKYTIGALITSEPVIASIRRELKKLKSGIKVEAEEIEDLIKEQVIKREVLESDSGKEALRQVSRHAKKQQRSKAKAKTKSDIPSQSGTPDTVNPISDL